MFAVIRLIEGYSLAFLWLGVFFFAGSAFLPPKRGELCNSRKAQRLISVVVTCLCGAAVYGLALFLLAVVGAFHPLTELSALIVIFAAGCVVSGDNPVRSGFWLNRVSALTGAWDYGSILVLAIAIVIGVPAVVSSNLQYDAINYHMAYAVQWARAGRLTIDPFVQFPFFTNGVPLFFAQAMQLHAYVFLEFLSWAMGLLTALGVYAAIGDLCDSTPRYFGILLGVASATALLFFPAYLRWLNTGYVDATITAFALGAILSIHLFLRQRHLAQLYAAAIIIGFFIGLKSSLILLAPVALLSMVGVARHARVNLRTLTLTIGLLTVAAAPWFAFNTYLAGDPIPPTLNVALYGRDGLMTKDEWHSLQNDFRETPSLRDVWSVPWRAFADPTSRPFRDDGAGALMLLLYACAASFTLGILAKRLDKFGILYGSALGVLIAYWLFTSTLLRYGTVLLPLIPIAFIASIRWLTPNSGFRRALVAFCIILTLVPSPAAVMGQPAGTAFYRRQYDGYYRYLLTSYTSDDAYTARMVQNYEAVTQLSSIIRNLRLTPRVYLFTANVRYYFEREGIRALGEWEGPSGYWRLVRGVQTGVGAAFIRNLNVSAVLIPARGALRNFAVPLEGQLQRAGFCIIDLQQGDIGALNVNARLCRRARHEVALAR